MAGDAGFDGSNLREEGLERNFSCPVNQDLVGRNYYCVRGIGGKASSTASFATDWRTN